MDNSKFKETKKWLTYQVNTHTHHKDYDIEKELLDEVREWEDRNANEQPYKNVSEWVAHLSGKGWASRRMMLLLCDIIKRVHPDNKIDWQETQRLIDNTYFYC